MSHHSEIWGFEEFVKLVERTQKGVRACACARVWNEHCRAELVVNFTPLETIVPVCSFFGSHNIQTAANCRRKEKTV